MSIRKAVEGRGGAPRISSHILKVQPITNINDVAESAALRDAIDSITSWAPNTILDDTWSVDAGA